MRNIYVIPATIILITACIQAKLQDNTMTQKYLTIQTEMAQSDEEKIARQIFKSLHDEDEQLWLALYPTNDEYKEILQLMLNKKMEGLTQQKIDEMLTQREKEAPAAYKEDFDSFKNQASNLGINWEKAVYKQFNFLPYLPSAFPGKYLNGDILFTFQNQEFKIERIEAIETPSGFKLQSIKAIRKTNNK